MGLFFMTFAFWPYWYRHAFIRQIFTPLICVISLCAFLYPVRNTRRLIKDLEVLPTQLRNFSIRDVECFCCATKHRHPETGEALSCDRLAIYSTLRKWFGPEDGCDDDEHLDTFDEKVRTLFGHALATKVCVHRLEYTHALLMALP